MGSISSIYFHRTTDVDSYFVLLTTPRGLITIFINLIGRIGTEDNMRFIKVDHFARLN